MAKGPKNSPLFEQMFGHKVDTGRIVSYDGVPAMVLARLVVAVVDSGCAVLFGRTRDGGAWAVTFMGDDIPNKRQTEYQNDPDELVEWLEFWAQSWEGVAETLKVTGGSQNGHRKS